MTRPISPGSMPEPALDTSGAPVASSTAVAARYDCAAPGATYAGMAAAMLAKSDARAAVAHIQNRLGLVLEARGFVVEAWQGVPNLNDDATLVALASTLRITDPLSQASFEALLRLSLRSSKARYMLAMTTEAVQLPGREVVVSRTPLAFMTWDPADIGEQQLLFGIALKALATEPENIFDDSDFVRFPEQLIEALAP